MRTIKGAARTKAKRRLFKKAKGYRGGRGNLLRTVKETLIRSGAYAYRDRKNRKRSFRRLWIVRINAAAHEHGLSYSRFIAGLKMASIDVDRKVLADLAIHEKGAFAVLAEQAKAALAAAAQEPEAAAPAAAA
jgi:large subunit ribosomal protein L20